MQKLESEEETNIEFSKESKEEMLNKLKDKKLLNYGALITEADIESIINVSKKHYDYEKWQFLKLQFRELIKNEGFFVTSRGRQENLYILERHEMAEFNDSKNKAQFRNLKTRQRALHMIDESCLSKEQGKKLEFEILRNASLEIEMSNQLRQRCRY